MNILHGIVGGALRARGGLRPPILHLIIDFYNNQSQKYMEYLGEIFVGFCLFRKTDNSISYSFLDKSSPGSPIHCITHTITIYDGQQ